MFGLPDDYSKYFGYFVAGQSSDKPTHDPGLAVGCPFCSDPLPENAEPGVIRVTNLGKKEGAVSFFYRAHEACCKRVGPEEIAEFEIPLTESMAFEATQRRVLH